jgi:hypothetical protein
MVAAPPSSTPSRPSRNNTANLHDNLNLNLNLYESNDGSGGSGSGSSGGINPAKRQRRMSLPSSPSTAAAHDGQFVTDVQDSEQNNPYGTFTPSSLPGGMRSRSGTQSQKSKKSMLSFMSGASSSPLLSLHPFSFNFAPFVGIRCHPLSASVLSPFTPRPAPIVRAVDHLYAFL